MRRGQPVPPDATLAWLVGEGDIIAWGGEVLPRGGRVISIHREPVDRWVRIVTDAGEAAELAHDHRVTVVRRAR